MFLNFFIILTYIKKLGSRTSLFVFEVKLFHKICKILISKIKSTFTFFLMQYEFFICQTIKFSQSSFSKTPEAFYTVHM